MLDLRMQYSPPSPFQNDAVGFHLYGGDAKLLCTGTEARRDDSSATVACSFQAEVPDSMVVQVLNYQGGLAINYMLQVSGAVGSISDVTDNGTPDRAFVLTAQNPAARGSLPVGPEGTYGYYLLRYPGGNQIVNVGIALDQANGYADGTIGFGMYQGSDDAGKFLARLTDDGKKRIASVTINQAEATTFGIQVFNWTKGRAVPYKIYVSGLPS